MPPTQQTKTSTAAPKTAPKRGRKAVADKEAPHGRDAQGKPLAPHGLLDNGLPRVYPKRDAGVLDLGSISNAQQVTEELAEVVRPARARSEQQQAMDKLIKTIHGEWVTAGKPSEWAKLPKRRIDVEPDQADTLKFLARKAAEFNGVRVRFGQVAQTREGKAVVTFAAMDKSEKKTAKKS